MSIILEDWYQLDFVHGDPSKTLREISLLMDELLKKQLIKKWFFLHEGATIRIRMQSKNKDSLQKEIAKLALEKALVVDERFPFSQYKEAEDTLFNKKVVNHFANVMSDITELTISKLKNETDFNTYRIMERISHCLFNNMAGLCSMRGKNEEYFLKQRFLERTRQAFDNDFES